MTRDLGCKKVLLAGASYHHGAEMLALLEEFGHIYVETSWQVSPGIVGLLAGAAGSDRILFGSMAPMRPALNMVAEAELSDSQKTAILARNALRFLGREEHAARVADEAPQLMGMPQVPAIDVHCPFSRHATGSLNLPRWCGYSERTRTFQHRIGHRFCLGCL